jgi:signal transduction protein with GAF and PtsI domain
MKQSLFCENGDDGIVVAVRSVIPHDRCAIFLPDSKTKVMRLFAIESTVDSSHFVVGMEVDPRDSHVGWRFHHQQPLLRRNLELERDFPSEDALFPEGFDSLLSVPLIVKGQVLVLIASPASLVIASRRPKAIC